MKALGFRSQRDEINLAKSIRATGKIARHIEEKIPPSQQAPLEVLLGMTVINGRFLSLALKTRMQATETTVSEGS